MNCIYLISPHELIEQAHFIKDMGYNIELYPSTQDTSCLRDNLYEQSAAYLGRSPESSERHHVRSLRASFIRMLTDTRFDSYGDDLIFCESDCVPTIHADDLRCIVAEQLRAHPEADVIRLFRTAVVEGKSANEGIPADLHFFPLESYPHRDANTPAVWGTHALIIPKRSRHKIADIFASYQLPTDIALEAAHGKQEISILTCSGNLFIQHPRTEPQPTPGIALMLSSYKRYNELQRQIWCMMDQDYEHKYHLFVAAKGISENTFKHRLYPQFEHFITAGKLTLRHFPNKNQLSNLLDCVRDIDTTDYDLFAKIDDDDIYDRHYLRSVYSFHRHLPLDIGSHYSGWGSYLTNAGSFPHFTKGSYHCYGPTIVVPAQVLKKLFEYENNPSQYIGNMQDVPWHPGLEVFGFAEDAIIDRINHHAHASNRATYIETMGYADSVSVSQIHGSVTRGHYIAGDFWEHNTHINTNPKNDEIVIDICHPRWQGLMRLFAQRATHLNSGDAGDILFFDNDLLTVKWDQWDEEHFIRDDSGVYHLQQ